MKRKHYIHVKFYAMATWMRLYNFRINRWDLQIQHKLWLDELAIPFLREDSARTMLLIGMTSRSGSEAHNVILSKRRASEVLNYFSRSNLENRLDERFGGIKAGGERYAKNKGHKDGKEDDYFRAVDIWLLRNLIYDPTTLPIEIIPMIDMSNIA